MEIMCRCHRLGSGGEGLGSASVLGELWRCGTGHACIGKSDPNE